MGFGLFVVQLLSFCCVLKYALSFLVFIFIKSIEKKIRSIMKDAISRATRISLRVLRGELKLKVTPKSSMPSSFGSRLKASNSHPTLMLLGMG